MNYIPDDLESINLSKSILYGYSKKQVDTVMSKILEDYNQNMKEINDLRNLNSVLSETVQHYKTIEESMQHCLIIAQHTSDEMIKTGNEKAKSIIDGAQETAQKLVKDAYLEINKIKFSFEDTKAQILTFKTKAAALLNAQLDVLKQLSES